MSELLQINQELQREELIKKWGIRLGKQALSSDPDKQYEDMVPVPTNPHVFFINSLTLWSLKIDEVVKLKDVMVMFAHGEISGKKQEWRFIGTKKLVKQTVEGYNRVAKDMGWPPIDVVLACRGRSVDQLKKELEKERNSKGKTNKEGVVWFKMPFCSG